MTQKNIGLIGCGEVGTIFARAMAARNGRMRVYDALLDLPGGQETLRHRLEDEAIEIASLKEVVSKADIILSAVTTQVAVQVAEDCLPYLSPGQVFVDLNSASPSIKIKIAELMDAAGKDFVEGAILGAVGATGAATQILLTGKRAQEVAQALNELGLNCTPFGSHYGEAASYKMLRSVFTKGVECLLLEMLAAGRRAGIEAELWKDVVSFISNNPFEKVAANWIQTHAVAYERRYHEMVQVVETLRELDIQPLMSEATQAFFQRSRNLGFETAFPKKPDNHDAVIEWMAEKLVE